MRAVKIKSVKSIGVTKTKDITVDSNEHLFYANGIAVSNSHAIAYAMFSAWQLYLKAYYYPEFVCCLLIRTPRAKKDKHGRSVLEKRIKDVKKRGMKILPPDINRSEENFTLQDGGIRFGLGGLKGISSASEEIIKNRPYRDFSDFMERTNNRVVHKGRMEQLIFAGCFDCFCEDETPYGYREEIYNFYHRTKNKKESANQQTFSFMQDLAEENDDYEAFSEGDLKLKEAEIIGMELMEDIRQKYAVLLKDDNSANTLNKLRTIQEVKEKGLKRPIVLCMVKSFYCFTSKKNTDWCKVQLTDGVYEAGLLVSQIKFNNNKRFFQKGNVLKLPVSVADGKGYDYFLNDNLDISIIEDSEIADVEAEKVVKVIAEEKEVKVATKNEFNIDFKKVKLACKEVDEVDALFKNSYEKCYSKGKAGEKFIEQTIFPKVMVVKSEEIEGKDKQNIYGDFEVKMEWGDTMHIEVKTDEYTTGNFFIETVSCEQTDNDGWIHKYEKVDNLFYHFPKDNHRVFSFKFQEFKKWCLDEKNIFSYVEVEEKTSGEDKTLGRLLPIEEALKYDWIREWDWKEGVFK